VTAFALVCYSDCPRNCDAHFPLMFYRGAETSNIQSYCITIDSTNFVLIDTPGFDDTFGSDADILKKMEVWLSSSYKSNRLLTGLLYLHPINKTRVDGSSMRGLKLFRELCGKKNFPNIVIGTTFWDCIRDPKTGVQREKELCESADFWRPMKEKGSRVFRIPRDYSTVPGILLDMAKKAPCTLQIQEETVVQGKLLQETSAGIAADDTATLRAEFMAEMRRRDEAQERALEVKRQQTQRAAAQERELAAEMERLRIESEQRDQRLRAEEATMHFNRSKFQLEETERQLGLFGWGREQNLVAFRFDQNPYDALCRWCDVCQTPVGAEKFYCKIIVSLSLSWL
jgi:hypothetical protein